MALEQLILVQMLRMLRMLLRRRWHVELSHIERAIHVTVGVVVVQLLALTHDVPSAAPPPQPRRLLPPLHGNLHLAAQGAQRHVDVQILEGATVPAENVVEHGRKVKVPPQDVCFVGLCS